VARAAASDRSAPVRASSRAVTQSILLLHLAGCAGLPLPARGAAPAPPTAPEIAVADLRHRVGVLAADSMAGRGVGTPGALRAARYLAREAARIGLEPAGDGGTFFHHVPLHRRHVSAAVSFEGSAEGLAATEVLPVSGLGGLPGSPRAEGSGRVLYAGYLADDSVGPGELRTEQLQGAVVVLRMGHPDGRAHPPRPALSPLFMPGSEVAAVLLVAEGPLAEFHEYAADLAQTGQLLRQPSRYLGDNPAYFLVSSATAERIVGRRVDGLREPLLDLGGFAYRLTERTAPVEAWNIVGLLRGRAPGYVALGAHYDHLGIGPAVAGDSVYNGADDNASGTAALLEIAEHFAALDAAARPGRSLLFVWHTAEEGGLFGSDAFTAEPTVPREEIVAQLNLDMVARNHPDTLIVVGSRRLSSELGELVESVNAASERPFALDLGRDAPDHPERLYCRSDHYNYARHGIPVAHFTTGLHDDYHRPSDTIGRIDPEKLFRVTRLVAEIAGAVAERPEAPRVDGPIPHPEAPCR
jgi:hypothetical protein